MAEKIVAQETATKSSNSDHDTIEAAMDPPSNYTLKLDLRLIPLLGCTYTILFLDRTNIANARIEGLEKGLNMPPHGYNTCIWIFFIPFVLIEIPSNMIMGLPHVKPCIFLGINMLVLGIISTCQGLTASYEGLLALRFLMGIFEATLPAGAAFLISEYYTRKEASLRFACFFTFGILGPCISGLLAYGLRNMNGIAGKEGWRWIFIIEGLLTIFISFFVFFFVPHFPEKSDILTPAEKAHLLQKLKADKGDQKLDLRSVNWFKVLSDYKIWFPVLMFFCCDMTAASMSAFIPTILTELGWKAAYAQVMSIPIWLTGIVFQVTASWISGRTNIRFPFILFGIAFAMVGWIIQVVYSDRKGLAPGIRYFSLFAMSGGTFIQMAMSTAWMTNNLRGRASAAVGTAMVLGLGNCANFVAANVFVKKEAPFYPTGFRTGLGITIAGAAVCMTFVGILWRHNVKLEKKRREVGGGVDDQKEYRYQI
ncbi:MFS general substrate transporter [Aaosphaeria arxii CBS 175.79]|uniref:MFS general substrate transporter n=1 Tax=Aaosphaeria arxii CBS 175.79 TaxID=1450172 RepID=A0A6A5XQJ7_9PLEO|nr:MFS general substrate transporter [Aaosphaeria arxii CBS 175.79]KAF2015107.1 MFS general substrate transporter [Aaosphaeria arxii CBS 175.79]